MWEIECHITELKEQQHVYFCILSFYYSMWCHKSVRKSDFRFGSLILSSVCVIIITQSISESYQDSIRFIVTCTYNKCTEESLLWYATLTNLHNLQLRQYVLCLGLFKAICNYANSFYVGSFTGFRALRQFRILHNCAIKGFPSRDLLGDKYYWRGWNGRQTRATVT